MSADVVCLCNAEPLRAMLSLSLLQQLTPSSVPMRLPVAPMQQVYIHNSSGAVQLSTLCCCSLCQSIVSVNIVTVKAVSNSRGPWGHCIACAATNYSSMQNIFFSFILHLKPYAISHNCTLVLTFIVHCCSYPECSHQHHHSSRYHISFHNYHYRPDRSHHCECQHSGSGWACSQLGGYQLAWF